MLEHRNQRAVPVPLLSICSADRAARAGRFANMPMELGLLQSMLPHGTTGKLQGNIIRRRSVGSPWRALPGWGAYPRALPDFSPSLPFLEALGAIPLEPLGWPLGTTGLAVLFFFS